MIYIAVILAGGSGNRFGADRPKQFLTMPDGRTILEHSVQAFARCTAIDEVCIVSREDWCDYVRELVHNNMEHPEGACWTKVTHVIPGGKERYHSTLAALEAYRDRDDVAFLIHDAVRPYISEQVITACIDALATADACAVGVPTTDTIWVTRDGCIAAIPDRRTLFNAQTPQCFRAPLLRDAFRRALQDPHFLPTDDCGVVLTYRPDIPIRIIPGNPSNIKITFPSDIR